MKMCWRLIPMGRKRFLRSTLWEAVFSIRVTASARCRPSSEIINRMARPTARVAWPCPWCGVPIQ